MGNQTFSKIYLPIFMSPGCFLLNYWLDEPESKESVQESVQVIKRIRRSKESKGVKLKHPNYGHFLVKCVQKVSIPSSCWSTPFLYLYKILRSQRIQILTEDSERKFLSKRELIRFFEKDCQRQNVAAVAFVLFPREGTEGRGFAWQASEEDS